MKIKLKTRNYELLPMSEIDLVESTNRNHLDQLATQVRDFYGNLITLYLDMLPATLS